MPLSNARVSAARETRSSVSPYDVAPAVRPPMPQPPKPIAETVNPVDPSARYLIGDPAEGAAGARDQ
jgi:hypothetical protein